MKKIQFALIIYFFGSIISCCSDDGSITYETIKSANVLLFSFDENGIFPYLEAFNPNELGIAVSADSISSRIVFAKPLSNIDIAYACDDPNLVFYTNTIDSLNIITVYDFDDNHLAGSQVNDLLLNLNSFGNTSSINVQEVESISHIFKFSKASENDSLQFKITGRITSEGVFEKTTDMIIFD
jgi:hypothetical protein